MINRMIKTFLLYLLFLLLNLHCDTNRNLQKDNGFPIKMSTTNDPFYNRFRDSSESDFKGLVSALGCSIISDIYESTLAFYLEGLVQNGKSILKEKIRVEMPVNETQKDYFKQIKPYSIVKFRGKMGMHPNGNKIILMTEIIGTISDNVELYALAVELKKPVIIKDSAFGILTLDRSINVFSGKTKWNKKSISLMFNCDKHLNIDTLIEHAKTIISASSEWNEKLTEFAAGKLTDLKNESWLDENESPVSEKQFKARLKLTTIEFDSDGEITFYFDDGDLFWGHEIVVKLGLDFVLIDAEIIG